MVNPERLHNAFAALDILARADDAAFSSGRNVAGAVMHDAGYPQRGTQAHTLMEIEREGYFDAKKGLTPYCPYTGKEHAAYKAGWLRGGGSSMFVKDSTRSDKPVATGRKDADDFTRGRNVAGEVMHDAEDPYAAGRAARRAGKGQATCPAKRGSPNGQKWLAGWQKEHEEMRSRDDALPSYVGAEFVVRYEEKSGGTTSVRVRAGSAKEAQDKVKRLLGSTVARIIQVTKNADSAQASKNQFNRRADKLENAKPGTPGFGRNIAREIEAGKPAKQAEAIAYSKARGDAGSAMRKWKVRYAGGAVVTVNAPDINAAKARAKQISPRLEPESIVIMDGNNARGDAGEPYLPADEVDYWKRQCNINIRQLEQALKEIDEMKGKPLLPVEAIKKRLAAAKELSGMLNNKKISQSQVEHMMERVY